MIFSLLAKGTLIEFLSSWQIIVAICLLAVGIAIALITHRLIRQNGESKKVTIWRIVSIITILVGLAFFIIGAAILGGIF